MAGNGMILASFLSLVVRVNEVPTFWLLMVVLEYIALMSCKPITCSATVTSGTSVHFMLCS